MYERALRVAAFSAGRQRAGLQSSFTVLYMYSTVWDRQGRDGHKQAVV